MRTCVGGRWFRRLCPAGLSHPKSLPQILKPCTLRPFAADRYDWQAVREQVAAHGVRNSLLVAPMPTASTSQVPRGFGGGGGWVGLS